MTIIKNASVDLGPYDLVLNGKVIGTVGKVTMEIAEATEEELAALRLALVILLVKPLPLTKEEEGP